MGPDVSLFSQLRLLVYPIVYNLLAPSQVLRRISSKGHYVIMIILELHKQPVVYGCFNWMIPNHYIKNGCFTKHPLKNCCLGYQDYLQNSCNLKRGSTSFLKGSCGNTLNLFGPICPPRCPRGDPPPIFWGGSLYDSNPTQCIVYDGHMSLKITWHISASRYILNPKSWRWMVQMMFLFSWVIFRWSSRSFSRV